MLRASTYRLLPILMACILLSGCMHKITIEKMREMTPPRPVELDKLDVFVGKWKITGETEMAILEEVVKTFGSGETKWNHNRTFLIGNYTFNMEGLDSMEAHETWTYDAHTGKYRSTWTDSMGATGTGVSWIDEKTNTWYTKAKSHGPMGATTMKGWVKIIDENTMKWVWTEYAMGGLIKTMEMKGISKRH